MNIHNNVKRKKYKYNQSVFVSWGWQIDQRHSLYATKIMRMEYENQRESLCLWCDPRFPFYNTFCDNKISTFDERKMMLSKK